MAPEGVTKRTEDHSYSISIYLQEQRDGYKNIGRYDSSHNRAGARLASGSRQTSYCCVFRYYGEWLSPLVGDSATTYI